MHVLSEINEHATFYSGVCVYVQQHTTGVFINNIQINVFLAEHRKTKEGFLRIHTDKKLSFEK